jgi:hypothetical protein
MEFDPLNLGVAALLIEAYDKSGKPQKSDSYPGGPQSLHGPKWIGDDFCYFSVFGKTLS